MDELRVEFAVGSSAFEEIADIRDYGARTSEGLDILRTFALVLFEGLEQQVDDPELVPGPLEEWLGGFDGCFVRHAGKVGERRGKSEPKLCSLDPMTQWGKVPE